MAGARCPECGADVFEMPSELTSALEGHRVGAHDLKPQVASELAPAWTHEPARSDAARSADTSTGRGWVKRSESED